MVPGAICLTRDSKNPGFEGQNKRTGVRTPSSCHCAGASPGSQMGPGQHTVSGPGLCVSLVLRDDRLQGSGR